MVVPPEDPPTSHAHSAFPPRVHDPTAGDDHVGAVTRFVTYEVCKSVHRVVPAKPGFPLNPRHMDWSELILIALPSSWQNVDVLESAHLTRIQPLHFTTLPHAV